MHPVLRLTGLLVVLAGLGAYTAGLLLTPKIATPVAKVCSALPDAGPTDFDLLLRCGKKLYSQHDEELIIRHFFRDRRGGVFVDVGSAHYRDNSNTYYLEHDLGWRGVAVDARAEYGADYLTHRPATKFFSFIVTDHSGTSDSFYELGTFYAMSSTSKAWAEENGHQDYVEVKVPTVTLNELLAKAGLGAFDFLSMDIETGEPAALDGFDIDRFHPSLVCIEVTGGVRDRVAAYFSAHGYELIPRYWPYDSINWYLRPKAAP